MTANKHAKYLCIDVGTHAVKSAIISSQGIERLCEQEINLHHGSSGEIEQTPQEILSAMQITLHGISPHLEGVHQAGLVCQRSSVLAWDKSNGQALSSVLSWQDTRGQSRIEKLTEKSRQKIKTLTGLQPSAHYGATKLAILNHYLGRHKHLGFGPLVSWLTYHLLTPSQKQWLCDEANGHRTLLYDLNARQWSPWLCKLFHVPASRLPELRPIQHEYGQINPFLTDQQTITLSAISGDQNAAFYGITRFSSARTLINIGTGAFVLRTKDDAVKQSNALLSTPIDSDDQRTLLASEGGVNGAGRAVEDYLIRHHAFYSVDDFFKRVEQEKNNWHTRLFYINTAGGLAAPWWRPAQSLLQSMFVSKDRYQSVHESEKALIVAESIVFLIARVLEEAGYSSAHPETIYVTGGLARSQVLVERLATVLNTTLTLPDEHEITLLGAAALASKGQLQVKWKLKEIQPNAAQVVNMGINYQAYMSKLESLVL